MHIPTPGDANDPQPDFDEALAAFGLVEETGEDGPQPEDKCYLWPCNVPAWNVWLCVQTQWRTSAGMDGARRTGLDYGGVAVCMRDVFRIPSHRRWHGTSAGEIWIGIHAMEIAAINVWEQQRQDNRHD